VTGLYRLPRVIVDAGGTTWEFTEIYEDLRHSDSSTGGNEQATWSLKGGKTPHTGQLPPPGARVRIYDDQPLPYWEGRIEYPQVDPFKLPAGGAGGLFQYLARGLASHTDDDQFEAKKIYLKGTTTDAAMLDAIQQKCPLINAGNLLVTPSGRALQADTDSYQLHSAQTIINSLSQFGYASNEQMLWAIRRFNGTSFLELKPRPTTPKYYVDLTQVDQAPFSWPLQIVYNKVIVKWSKGTVVVEDTTSQAAYPSGIGVKRSRSVDATDKIDNFPTAQFIALVMLGRLSRVRPVGNQVVVQFPFIVTDQAGNEVPLRRIEAGNVISVTGYVTGSSLVVTTPVFIRRAEWDEERRIQSMVTEELFSELSLIGKVLDDEKLDPTQPGEPPPHFQVSITAPPGEPWKLQPWPGEPGEEVAFSGKVGEVIANSWLPPDPTFINQEFDSGYQVGDERWLKAPAGKLTEWEFKIVGTGSMDVTVYQGGGAILSTTGAGSGTLAVNFESSDEWIRFVVDGTTLAGSDTATMAIKELRHEQKFEEKPPEEEETPP
jgi:hypothetical protein